MYISQNHLFSDMAQNLEDCQFPLSFLLVLCLLVIRPIDLCHLSSADQPGPASLHLPKKLIWPLSSHPMPSFLLLTLCLIPISLLYFQPDLVLTTNINYIFKNYENYEFFAIDYAKYVTHMLKTKKYFKKACKGLTSLKEHKKLPRSGTKGTRSFGADIALVKF